MLKLLASPEWLGRDGVRSCLAASLPGCLLVYLAAHGSWVDRESLAALFWPEGARDQARHRLRVNLHRLRQLLGAWGQDAALESERSRVRLRLPLDLHALRTAIDSGDGEALLNHSADDFLSGYRIAGFDGFWDWARDAGERWQRQWREAGEAALRQADSTGSVAWAAALRQCLDVQPSAEPELQTTPLIGRKPLLLQLRAGRSAMLLLGEAGVGKSSVLRAAFAEAPLLQCREGLAQIPFRPVVEFLQAQRPALRQLLAQAGSELAAYRLDVARLLPELAPDDALPPLDALTAKSRLLEALALVLEAQGPCVLVDDLQWCDSATLELLALLAHRGRCIWRAGARSHELGAAQRAWVDVLARGGLLLLIELDGLSLPAVAEFCAQREPQRHWTAVQLARLHAASAGHPFVLGELLLAGWGTEGDGAERALPTLVQALLQQRLAAMPPPVRALVEAAAVLARPMPLRCLAAVALLGDADPSIAVQAGLAAQLLAETEPGLQCRHDLVRHAVLAGLPLFQRQALHRRAALALAERAEGQAEPLAVAAHWDAAAEPQTALAWMLPGAEQLHRRGEFAAAQALWLRVADESLDATQGLQARLALAQSDLLHDLARGRRALDEILAHLSAVPAEPAVPAVPDPLRREQIEGQALAGLVDNAVFSGDLAAARVAAQRLRVLLPKLGRAERLQGCEVLIELAMREPDIPAAWALLEQMRRLAPRHPLLLSFEGQIHWFSGAVTAARDAFEALALKHPDYCRGLTIESDLAVMLQASGDLVRAEAMGRRSLQSWRGVAHTETLSYLGLGLTLTSAGRYGEALDALDEALRLGREQGSQLFEAEALVRRARLHLQSGRPALAAADLALAVPLLAGSDDPLRVTQFALACWLSADALGQPPAPGLLARVRPIQARSPHPLVQIRWARLQGLAGGDALLAARQQTTLARTAGLLEPLAEGLLLQALVLSPPSAERRALLQEALDIARRQGFMPLCERAQALLGAAPV